MIILWYTLTLTLVLVLLGYCYLYFASTNPHHYCYSYLYTYTYIYLYLYILIYLLIHTYIHTYIYTYAHTYILYIHTYRWRRDASTCTIWPNIPIYLLLYTYLYTNVLTYTHFYVCIQVTEGCQHVYNLAADMGGMGFIVSNQVCIKPTVSMLLCVLNPPPLWNTYLLNPLYPTGTLTTTDTVTTPPRRCYCTTTPWSRSTC
jgi:hypothetical protein